LETDDLGEVRPGVSGSQSGAAISECADLGATADEPRASEAAQRPERSGRDEAGWVDEKLKSILESLLFSAGEPVSLAQLANALEEVARERIRKMLNEMAVAYAASGRGFVLEEIAGGYQLRTPSDHAVYVRRLLSAKPPRLSRPVLETVAIVAYRQPITRPEIEQLRGVDSGGVLDTLVERNLIKMAGRKDAPGRPIIYTTTPEFLELFGLKGLENLPDLEEFRELEGLRDPAQAPPTSPQADSQCTTPQAPQEPAEQRIADEPVNDSPVVQVIGEASAVDPAGSEEAVSSAEADEPTAVENSGGSEDSQ
jgi:segregation and condensation protein B